MNTDVYNLKNEKVGQVELPQNVFGVAWKPGLIKQALLAQMANRRNTVAHAKTRAEVRGGGRKPWRQKGTGRARHGSIRSPLWSGGGKAHGPLKTRNFSQRINKKMRRLAVMSLLSKKLKDNEVRIFDTLAMPPKAKIAEQTLKPILGLGKKAVKYDVLLVPESGSKDLIKAVRNLPKTKVTDARSLNVYDLANHKHIFVDKQAVEVIGKHYSL